MASENKNFKFQIPRGLIEGGTQISTGRTKGNAFERFSHEGEGNRLNPYFYGSFATDFPLNFKKRKSFSNVFPFE
jgi:hypothetical protein